MRNTRRARYGRLTAAALLIGIATLAAPGLAAAQSNDGHERTRPVPSVTCRVSGLDARGQTRIVLIRVDQSRAWSIVEETALTECRAGYRLQNCTIINCL